MELRVRLKRRRLELGLTLKQVAKVVGVSEGTVSKWESGSIGSMRLDKARALSRALSIDPRAFMEQDEPDSKTKE